MLKIERGKSLKKKMVSLSTVRRFWQHVEIGADGCWHWKGSIYKWYGYFWTGKRTRLAHRVSYVLFVKDIKFGMDIHHKCMNTDCVNPEHLVQCTRKSHVGKHYESEYYG
ncbi:MAG: HNH endonuclease signature motif containing protein [Minisyncoccia bacterium]